MALNLKSLVGKLSARMRTVFEGSAALCLSRTHYTVELEHFLAKLAESTDTDAALIFRHFGIDGGRLEKDIARSLDVLKTGNSRTPSLSPWFTTMLTESWSLASLEFGAAQIRSGHAVLAIAGHT